MIFDDDAPESAETPEPSEEATEEEAAEETTEETVDETEASEDEAGEEPAAEEESEESAEESGEESAEEESEESAEESGEETAEESSEESAEESGEETAEESSEESAEESGEETAEESSEESAEESGEETAEESSEESGEEDSELTLGESAPEEEEPRRPRQPALIRGKIDRHGVAIGTGRRKTSVARVRIIDGDGAMTINGRVLDDYFQIERDRQLIEAPLKATEMYGSVNVWVRVNGGGLTGQAGAIVLGIARALQAKNPDLHEALSDGGYLTRDGRMVERKKYGYKKARKSFQFSKR
jgi:small subunit ribosomal protein S9